MRSTLKVNQSCARPLAMGLPKPAWVRLDRLRTGVGKFWSFMHKWGLALTSICECSPLDQTAAHAILECSLYRASGGYYGLLVLHDETLCCHNKIVANI